MLSKDPLRRPADGRAVHAASHVGLDQPAAPAAADLDDTQFPRFPAAIGDARCRRACGAATAASSIACCRSST
jgi:hypothetical protein